MEQQEAVTINGTVATQGDKELLELLPESEFGACDVRGCKSGDVDEFIEVDSAGYLYVYDLCNAHAKGFQEFQECAGCLGAYPLNRDMRCKPVGEFVVDIVRNGEGHWCYEIRRLCAAHAEKFTYDVIKMLLPLDRSTIGDR